MLSLVSCHAYQADNSKSNLIVGCERWYDMCLLIRKVGTMVKEIKRIIKEKSVFIYVTSKVISLQHS